MQQLSPNHSSASHEQTLCSSPHRRLNKTFTRTITSQRSGKGTAHSIAGLHSSRSSASVMACTHTFFLDMQGIRQGLACWLVLEAAQEWWHHRQTGASSMNYTQTQLAHRSSKGRQQNCTESGVQVSLLASNGDVRFVCVVPAAEPARADDSLRGQAWML
jgi:hypothetical protein